MTDSLAEDWIALWQSEMAAMAADRELRESWTGLLALWASVATAAVHFAPGRRYDGSTDASHVTPNGAAGAAKPAGAAAAAAASDAGGDETRRLYERIAELESRLAAVEQRRDARPAGPGEA